MVHSLSLEQSRLRLARVSLLRPGRARSARSPYPTLPTQIEAQPSLPRTCVSEHKSQLAEKPGTLEGSQLEETAGKKQHLQPGNSRLLVTDGFESPAGPGLAYETRQSAKRPLSPP
jgi:hypothetical protein